MEDLYKVMCTAVSGACCSDRPASDSANVLSRGVQERPVFPDTSLQPAIDRDIEGGHTLVDVQVRAAQCLDMPQRARGVQISEAPVLIDIEARKFGVLGRPLVRLGVVDQVNDPKDLPVYLRFEVFTAGKPEHRRGPRNRTRRRGLTHHCAVPGYFDLLSQNCATKTLKTLIGIKLGAQIRPNIAEV